MVSYAGPEIQRMDQLRWGNRCVNSPPSTTDCPSPLRSTGGDLSLAARLHAGRTLWELSTVFVYASGGAYARRATSSPAVRSSADTAPTTAPACRITTGSTCRSPTGCGGNRGAAASISPLQPLRPPQPALHLVAGARRRREARIPDPSAPALPLHRHPLRKLDFQILNAP